MCSSTCSRGRRGSIRGPDWSSRRPGSWRNSFQPRSSRQASNSVRRRSGGGACSQARAAWVGRSRLALTAQQPRPQRQPLHEGQIALVVSRQSLAQLGDIAAAQKGPLCQAQLVAPRVAEQGQNVRGQIDIAERTRRGRRDLQAKGSGRRRREGEQAQQVGRYEIDLARVLADHPVAAVNEPQVPELLGGRFGRQPGPGALHPRRAQPVDLCRGRAARPGPAPAPLGHRGQRSHPRRLQPAQHLRYRPWGQQCAWPALPPPPPAPPRLDLGAAHGHAPPLGDSLQHHRRILEQTLAQLFHAAHYMRLPVGVQRPGLAAARIAPIIRRGGEQSTTFREAT